MAFTMTQKLLENRLLMGESLDVKNHNLIIIFLEIEMVPTIIY